MAGNYVIAGLFKWLSAGFRGNQYTEVLVSPQNEDLPKTEKTSERIAKENGISKSYVDRAEKYADGVDAADEVLPEIWKELLSGTIHPTQSAVTAVARAAPEDRAELAEQLRQPRTKPEKAEEPEGDHIGNGEAHNTGQPDKPDESVYTDCQHGEAKGDTDYAEDR